MTTNNDIVKYARTWMGAKWRHQGRGTGPNRAIDCVGLLVVTANHFNLPYTDLKGYRRDPSDQFTTHIKQYSDAHPVPIHGAIGLFTDTVSPCHCGIFALENGTLSLIHSEVTPAGRVHETILEPTQNNMLSRLIGVRLFKEVEYVG